MTRGAVVLCGGRSSRMGRDKATLPFGDGVLLTHVLERLADVVTSRVVVARPDQELPDLPEDVRVVHDDVPGQGPLGGIAPGLRVIDADAAYVTACDVPFLSRAFVRGMFDVLGDHEIAVPVAEGFVHALSAVYRPRVYPIAERLLREGWRRPRFLFEEVRTRRVEEATLRRFDPDLDTLQNLNTPDAYDAACARLDAERR